MTFAKPCLSVRSRWPAKRTTAGREVRNVKSVRRPARARRGRTEMESARERLGDKAEPPRCPCEAFGRCAAQYASRCDLYPGGFWYVRIARAHAAAFCSIESDTCARS